MKKETVMMRVTPEAKRRIKMGSAEDGVSMIDYIDALSLYRPPYAKVLDKTAIHKRNKK